MTNIIPLRRKRPELVAEARWTVETAPAAPEHHEELPWELIDAVTAPVDALVDAALEADVLIAAAAEVEALGVAA